MEKKLIFRQWTAGRYCLRAIHFAFAVPFAAGKMGNWLHIHIGHFGLALRIR